MSKHKKRYMLSHLRPDDLRLRCQDTITRDGFWTNEQCSRAATRLVVAGRGHLVNGLPLCTQHAKHRETTDLEGNR